MTSCFVYKDMGLTFHDRINTQMAYRFELAQVVARRKNIFLGSNLTGCSFLFGRGGLILLFSSCLFFLFIFFSFFYPSRNGEISPAEFG